MPKTVSAELIWEKDDRKLWSVSFDDSTTAKTWSKAISQVGWSGELESYTKQNNRGEDETFVKQPPKEGFSGGFKGAPRDNDIIRAQWAIGQAVAVELVKNPEKMDMANVEAYANEFFDMAERVKQPTQQVQGAPPEVTNYLPITQIQEEDPWNGLDLSEPHQ